MASLKLEQIYKVYPNGHKAVSDFNMEIEDGEFIVFVGPSGCGKSTTLRMIAGLEDISSGELYIGDTLVNEMQPKDRDIAMVFQNYALYPHMTVYENMAFGLVLRKIPRTIIHEKVMWAADILGLREYLDRKPKAMSGGQRQRVSLGRAILRNPKVMLLDEPLSNLDAKLRSQMRSEISKLHQQLKTTFIYVTHDQVEAMTLGTRVVVMKLGRIQQIDSPKNLYDHPVNKFVAGFIGTPQMNFFNVTLKEEKDCVEVHWSDCDQPVLKLNKELLLKSKKRYLDGKSPIILGFRCEEVSAEPEDVKGNENIVNVQVSHFEELGNETLIYGDLKEIASLGGESKTPIIIKATSKLGYKPGDMIKARISLEHLHFFDAETEMTIIPQIPHENVLPVEIKNEKMTLFGTISKPESIDIDYLENGTITIPLGAIKVNEGNIDAKIILVENHGKTNIAMVEADKKRFFVFVSENAKVGDKLKLSIDYSQATFKDEEEKVVLKPLIDKDELHSTFVNFKTAYGVTKNEQLLKIKEERINKTKEEYALKEQEFFNAKEKDLADAKQRQEQLKGEVAAKEAEIKQKQAEIEAELKASKTEYKANLKEAKARHKKIIKDATAAIYAQYKKMWEDEKRDYIDNIKNNKDKESVRTRKLNYQIFKENFPLMRKSDLDRKINTLEFDKETEINALKSRFTQKKNLLKEQIKENQKAFKEEYFPFDVKSKEYALKEKELFKQKEEALLKAELIFFFKYDDAYQIIPDFITEKIIQGLGSKVFTKIFSIKVPHKSFKEDENGILPLKVVALINYGDTKLYKCVGELYGQKVVVYINKEREIEIGTNIKLTPILEESEIYESSLNIRLY